MFTFYTLPDTRVHNSFKELCIMRAAAFTRVLKPYGGAYIYCHPQIDCFVISQLFSVARHVGRLKLGLKPAQFYIRLSIRPLSQLANHVSSGIIRHYVVAFVLFYLAGYQSAQFVRRALHYVSSSCKFLCQSAQLPWGVYI